MRELLSLAAGVVLVTGCGRTTGEPAPAPSAAPPVASQLPVDHTLPDELPEGPVKVLGLALPRGFVVARVFEGQTIVRGDAPTERAATYLRRRLDVGSVEVGATRTLFPSAHVRGVLGNPLRIEVNERGSGSEIVIYELKAPPVDPTLSQEERWRRAGFKPSGGLLDPQKAF